MCSERSPRWRTVVLKLESTLQLIDALYTSEGKEQVICPNNPLPDKPQKEG